MLKVVAGAKLVNGSVRWDRAAGFYKTCAFVRARRAGRGRGRLGVAESGVYVRGGAGPANGLGCNVQRVLPCAFFKVRP